MRIIGLLVIGVVGLLVLAGIMGRDDRPISVKIKESCRAEFWPDEYKMNDCEIQLSLKYLADREKGKLDSAYGKVR